MSEAQTAAKQKPRYGYLDISKGFAIISVVLLHLFNTNELLTVASPWHIWQAMPIFLFVAGITGSLVWKKYKGDIAKYYQDLPAKIWPLYLPYAIVVVIYYLFSAEPLTLKLFGSTMLMGYLGPGGYFVPLIVQHLFFFPLILLIREKSPSDIFFLSLLLVMSAVFEFYFAFEDADATKFAYRVYYFRYLFVCGLGAVLVDNNPLAGKKWAIYLLVAVSAVYMYGVCYQNWNFGIIRQDGWLFQHYPAYFYTAFLVMAIRKYEAKIPWQNVLVTLGKSSYDIFIMQMLFFITIYNHSTTNIAVKGLSFFVCIFAGLALTKAKQIFSSYRKAKA